MEPDTTLPKPLVITHEGEFYKERQGSKCSKSILSIGIFVEVILKDNTIDQTIIHILQLKTQKVSLFTYSKHETKTKLKSRLTIAF